MDEDLERVILKHRKSFINVIIADELVDYFPSLQTEDKEAVEAEQKNYGKLKGAKCLLDRVKRKISLHEFVEGLQDAGYLQLVQHISGSATSSNRFKNTAQVKEHGAPVSCTDADRVNIQICNNGAHDNRYNDRIPILPRGPQEHEEGREIEEKCFLPVSPELFGRRAIVQQIEEDFLQEDVSVGLVTGSAGFGKTSVANTVCHCLIEHGVVCSFISLKSVKSSKGIMQQILTALQCGISSGHESPPGKVYRILKSDGKRVLLFDHAEDLLEDDDLKDKFIDILEKICMFRYVKVLITSRRDFKALALRMKTYHIGELNSEDAVNMLCSKVNLEHSMAAKLAEACGYAPLALAIITTLVEERNMPEEILKSFKDGKIIKTLSPDCLGKNEKILTCIEMSYKVLDESLRCAFVSLAVFPRSFDIDAAAAVLGLPRSETYLNVLDPLTRRCFLEYDARSERWSFHVLLHAFALEMQKRDQVVSHVVACNTFTHRFCSYYVRFLDEKSKAFGSDALNCLKRCEKDRFNIIKALSLAKYAQFNGQFIPLTQGALGQNLCEFLMTFLSVDDLLEFYNDCIFIARNQGNIEREVTLLCYLGNVYISSVNCTFMTLPEGPGNDCVSRALKLLQKLSAGDSLVAAHALAMIGSLEMELLKFEEADKHMKRALRIMQKLGDCPNSLARLMIDLAKNQMCQNRTKDAFAFLDKAKSTISNLLDSTSLAKTYLQFYIDLSKAHYLTGHLRLGLSQPAEALTAFSEAYSLQDKYSPNHPDNRFVLDGIAHCHLKLKNFEKAIEFYEKGCALRGQVVGVELPVNKKVIGYAYFEMGNFEKSIALERDIMAMWKESAKMNQECLKFVTNEETRKFVYTVYYALISPKVLKSINEIVFKTPPSIREIRIRDFAAAMWSSDKVCVLQLEPERYTSAISHVKQLEGCLSIGEFCAIDERGQIEFNHASEVLLDACKSPDGSDKSLLIIRPMPPVEKKSLQLPVIVCKKSGEGESSCCVVPPQEKNKSIPRAMAQPSNNRKSSICTIL